MNMVHGTLVVEPSTSPAGNGHGRRAPVEAAGRHAAAHEEMFVGADDPEMVERKAEIADLTRRVLIGAVLTAPVLFAVMADG